MNEATVTINGRQLDPGQVMTLHVAIQAYLMDMTGEPCALGDDEHARIMAAAYAKRCREISKIMYPDAVTAVVARIE
jgi:hypothetical protein